MATINVEKNRYTVDSLYQWSKDQVLTIYGLSLATIPEIHFTNSAMEKAIVRQATMDDTGVISTEIPNSLLQKPYKISVYVCIYEGEAFKTLYSMVIPVEARNKPADYVLEVTDEEVYSFNALENKIDNVLAISLERYDQINAKYEEVNENYERLVSDQEQLNADFEAINEKYEQTDDLYNQAVDTLNSASNDFNNAETVFKNATTAYNNATAELTEAKNNQAQAVADLETAETNLTNATNELNTAKTNYNNAVSEYEDAVTIVNTAHASCLQKTGDTMTGVLKAQNNTSYTTMQVRNIAVVAEGASAPSGGNGDLYFTYGS